MLLAATNRNTYPITVVLLGVSQNRIVDLDPARMVDDFAKHTMATNAIVLGCSAVLVVVCVMTVSQRRRLMQLEKEVDRQEILRGGEHVGRIKAEKVRAVRTFATPSYSARNAEFSSVLELFQKRNAAVEYFEWFVYS